MHLKVIPDASQYGRPNALGLFDVLNTIKDAWVSLNLYILTGVIGPIFDSLTRSFRGAVLMSIGSLIPSFVKLSLSLW